MYTAFLICILAAFFALLIVFALRALVLLPVESENFLLLLSARGNGENLEQRCRTYLFLQGLGVLRRDLIIVDRGLTAEGRRLAEQLVRTYPQLQLGSWPLPETMLDGEDP